MTATTGEGVEATSDFAQPVTLDFTVGADALPAGASADELVVAFWNGSKWVEVSTTVTENSDGREPDRGSFDRPVDMSGVNAVVWRGGDVSTMFAQAPGATAVWLFDEGQAYGYVTGAPDFVNAAFTARFGNSLPADTIAFVVMP